MCNGRLQYFVKSFKKSPKHKIQKMLSNYQVSPIPDPSIYLVDKPGSRFDDRLIAQNGHKEIKFYLILKFYIIWNEPK